MKITIEIDSRLVDKAKTVALREGTTLDASFENGLNLALIEHRQRTFKLRDASVDGNGLHPDAAGRSWSALVSSLDRFSDDFMNERDEGGAHRDTLDK